MAVFEEVIQVEWPSYGFICCGSPGDYDQWSARCRIVTRLTLQDCCLLLQQSFVEASPQIYTHTNSHNEGCDTERGKVLNAKTLLETSSTLKHTVNRKCSYLDNN